MKHLPTAPDPQRLDLHEAISLLLKSLEPVTECELLPVAEALGRITDQACFAPVSLPPFPASAMDGYAFAFDHCNLEEPLKVCGKAAAGHPFVGELPAQGCIRILTGAPLPRDADTVVIQENVHRDGESLSLLAAPSRGANVRATGQDVEAGAQQLPAGHRLSPFDLAFLAASGHQRVSVYRRIRVRLLSSGDDLVDPGMPLGPGQIYDSNRRLLEALLARFPVELLGSERVADSQSEVSNALERASDADLLFTSGGVSVGDSDYLGQTLADEGELTFWRLNLKPGKPVALGRLNSGTWVLALPGNPVSTAVTALLLGRPLLQRLAGQNPDPVPTTLARLTVPLSHNAGREEYQRGRLTRLPEVETGTLPEVSVTGDQSSNRLSTFTNADCLIRIPKGSGNLAAGSVVEVISLAELLSG